MDIRTIYRNHREVILISIVGSIIAVVLLLGITGALILANKERVVAALVPATLSVEGTSREAQITGIVEQASGAVVSIVVTKEVPVVEAHSQPIDSSILDLFFNSFVQEEVRTQTQEIGAGSGFLVSSDGLIVTNRHVIDDTEATYTVVLSDGSRHAAMVLAKDTGLDIAVIKISGSGFTHLTFGNSDDLKVGQTVIAIGNALGEFRNTTSVGIVSGLSRNVVAGDLWGRPEYLDSVIQTDAAINLGNSGGPLLDLAGKVIGVNVAVAEGSENIGFALPGNAVQSIVKSVQEHGTIIRPYLGVRYVQITPTIQEEQDLPIDHGVLIVAGALAHERAVIAGSPAAQAGLKEGDIIISIDGAVLDEHTSLAGIIRSYDVGDTVTLVYMRDGREYTVRVTLEEKPEGI